MLLCLLAVCAPQQQQQVLPNAPRERRHGAAGRVAGRAPGGELLPGMQNPAPHVTMPTCQELGKLHFEGSILFLAPMRGRWLPAGAMVCAIEGEPPARILNARIDGGLVVLQALIDDGGERVHLPWVLHADEQ